MFMFITMSDRMGLRLLIKLCMCVGYENEWVWFNKMFFMTLNTFHLQFLDRKIDKTPENWHNKKVGISDVFFWAFFYLVISFTSFY